MYFQLLISSDEAYHRRNRSTSVEIWLTVIQWTSHNWSKCIKTMKYTFVGIVYSTECSVIVSGTMHWGRPTMVPIWSCLIVCVVIQWTIHNWSKSIQTMEYTFVDIVKLYFTVHCWDITNHIVIVSTMHCGRPTMVPHDQVLFWLVD